jgi:hypothetical protein
MRMLGLAVAAAAAAIIVAGEAGAAGASASPQGRSCSPRGLHPRVETITVRHVSCPAARTLLSEWRHRARQPNTRCVWSDGSSSPGVCTVRGWRCSAYHTTNGWNFPIVCETRAHRREARFVVAV